MEPPSQARLLGTPAPIPAGAGAPHLDGGDGHAQDEYEAALDAAARLLAASDKCGAELRERLGQKGFSAEAAERAVARLEELGIVDDAAFASRWAERRRRRGAAGGLIVAELTAKGVDGEIAREAVGDQDDAAAAHEIAVDLAARHGRLTPAQLATKVAGALARKGYTEEVVEEAVRAVLPPEGWD